ncbi:helix-turn-helix transcriptional regulator [Pararhizobium sp. BT-229]|uniref:helix-turn-helix transcriptional regulator n=1 Tax=Pararhizobium sp. BT-229 TaxID=2986923 RepID=UPI0035578352
MLNHTSPTSADSLDNDPYLSARQICDECGFTKPTLYALIRRGLLPQGERVGLKAVRWRRSVIDEARSRLNAGRRTRLDAEV